MEEPDVPVSVDYRIGEKARQWSEAALSGRPWRSDMFALFAQILGEESAGRRSRVLELGSGPGFLAEQVMRAGDFDYVALDFSAAMHELAKTRLGALADRVEFVERSLKDPGWNAGLGMFDYVITNQAVHELRHKRHAPMLHRQVRQVLAAEGVYLVSDHWLGEGGMSNDRMYMTAGEQARMLEIAGFARVEQVAVKGDLVMHRATASGGPGNVG